ncbi:hypothetical protein GO495_06520 [Chitinophaga oryziterrae]|uniref:Uncharacterized protein n=1 Tax=Chitinophaga oryziterrae TaxID=1031224 RepID=A0A6N8J6J1_9BACT|nr:hypothetical protein [Chitinophaga oryziterrae]MVT40228.1 hypothetical protein [Chitinophaga oryziterrae]
MPSWRSISGKKHARKASRFGNEFNTGFWERDKLIVNVSWPETLKIFDQIIGAENLLDEKEVYRQLKSSYSKQGDTVLEHQFHGLEMNAYIEYLSENRKESVKKYWLSRKLIKRERTIILLLSALTSNYGQSFWRSLITLGTVTAILFTCMVWAEGVHSLKFIPDFSGRHILATIAKALAFANPLRKYETELERWPPNH